MTTNGVRVYTEWTDERIENLWSEVFGSGFETWEWIRGVRYLEGDWDVPGKVRVKIEDPDDEGKTKAGVITPGRLIQALDKAAEKYVDACTGNPIHEHMNWDACSGDVLVQIAVLGDVYYS